MITPVPPSISDNAEAIRHASHALAGALENNSNPYRDGDKNIDVNALVPRILELFLGDAGPERPTEVDPFSALVGAATVLGISLRHKGSIDWITKESTR